MTDELGNRMKSNYENRSKTYLTRRVPVIIRLDGKAFHTFTKNFKKPYDEIFHDAMNATMKYLCENIQGCKIGYTQSDEITLLLTDYETIATDAWFGYNVQKVCSVSASMATLAFNQHLFAALNQYELEWKCGLTPQSVEIQEAHKKYVDNVRQAITKGAMFDSRCFSIPKDEVTNCFIWRQKDATRNAIQMLGQTYFSHKELDHKSQSDIQDMLMSQYNVNFNNMPIPFKRGVCCVRHNVEDIEVDFKTKEHNIVPKTYWSLDYNIPIFTENRDYIERYI